MGRRRVLRGPLIALLALAVAGAAAHGSAASGNRANTAAAAGGTLVVGRTGDLDTLDPHLATAFQTVQSLELVYDTLVQLNPKLQVVPDLATSWSFSQDGKTLTLKLRPGISFQDGSAFDSKDVKASLDRILDEKTGSPARSNLAAITSVETPDPLTVVLRLKEPDAPILAALADPSAAIVSSDDIASGKVGKFPNGTGAFKFKSWTPGQQLELVRNDAYWGANVKLAGIVFRVIPDEPSVVSALQAGNIQFGLLSDPLVAKQVKGNNLRVIRTPSLNYHVLQLNDTRPPLNDLRVRLAITCAIDRQEVVDSAALGEGKVTGPITIPAFRSNPNARPCPRQNLAKAKELLQEAGKGKGLTLKAIVETGEYSTAVNEAQSVQAQLNKVGIKLNLETLETGAFVKRWLAADFDAEFALNSGKADPDTMYGRYFTSTGSLNMVATFRSRALDRLFAEGRAETDPAKRKLIYDQISKNLEANAPWAWLFTGFDYRVVNDKVEGFVPMPNGSLKLLRQASLAG